MSKVELDKVEVLTLAVESLNCNGNEASIEEEYSGRCMYGDTTPAIIADCDLSEVNRHIRIATAELLDSNEHPKEELSFSEIADMLSKYELRKRDNMGRDYVYY